MAISVTNLLNEKEFVMTSGGTTHTTASFTPSSNCLLVIGFTFLSDGGVGGRPTMTQSGGLTCTKQIEGNDSAGPSVNRHASLWTIPVVTGASMTLTLGTTVQSVFSGDGTASAVSINQVTGYNSGGTYIGASASYNDAGSHSGTLSFALSATSASDSAVFAAISCDGDYGDGVVPAGSGWTGTYVTTAATSGWYRHTTEYIIASKANAEFGSFVDNWGHSACALEIIAAGGGGSPAKGRVGMQNADEGFAGASQRFGSLHPIGKGIVGWRKGLILPKRQILRVTHTGKRAA